MAVLNPCKAGDRQLSGRIRWNIMDVPNNLENPKSWVAERFRSVAKSFMWSRKTLWKSRLRNISVCIPGNEVRLMGAYFVTCTGCDEG